MSQSQTPEEIRRDIERTRAELSDNVNALGDSAKPSNIAREQVDKVRGRAADLKAKVFGDPNDPWDDGAVGDAGHALADARDSAADAVQGAPRQLKRQAQGNPLAAGLIAFGLGALVGACCRPRASRRTLPARWRMPPSRSSSTSRRWPTTPVRTCSRRRRKPPTTSSSPPSRRVRR